MMERSSRQLLPRRRAIVFGDDAVEAGRGEDHGHEVEGVVDVGDVGREVVGAADGVECVETDLAAGGGIGGRGGANDDGHS